MKKRTAIKAERRQFIADLRSAIHYRRGPVSSGAAFAVLVWPRPFRSFDAPARYFSHVTPKGVVVTAWCIAGAKLFMSEETARAVYRALENLRYAVAWVEVRTEADFRARHTLRISARGKMDVVRASLRDLDLIAKARGENVPDGETHVNFKP